MSRYYKLISSMPPAYITAVDRQALSVMLSTNAVEAHSARKLYNIRISQDLERITKSLKETAGGLRLPLDSEKKAARKMLQTIQKEEMAGRLFYEMHVSGAPGVMSYYKIHFFA